VEELQGLGAGPKTVAALRELSVASSTLSSPPPPAPPRSRSFRAQSIEQKRSSEEIIETARIIPKTLPNYLCVQ